MIVKKNSSYKKLIEALSQSLAQVELELNNTNHSEDKMLKSLQRNWENTEADLRISMEEKENK